jgi:type II secretory pathway component PulJ
MKKKKLKSYFTLLEVSIAIFLTGILLSSLWGFYHQSYKAQKAMQKELYKTHKELFLHQRLETLFAQIASPEELSSLFTPENSSSFSSPCLGFSYEHRIDPDPLFNGNARSLLYVDDKKRLNLATWPKNQEHCRIEILCTKVQELKISFFNQQTNNWQAAWEEEAFPLPLWVKIALKKTGETSFEEYIFRSCYPVDPIIYFEPIIEGPLVKP